MFGIERFIGRRPGSEVQKKPDLPKPETVAVPARVMKPEDIETKPYPAGDVFLNLKKVFERWKSTQKNEEEMSGTFALVAEKADTLERIYHKGGTDSTHLLGAFEGFEKQVELLDSEIKPHDTAVMNLGELPTQKKEVEGLQEWRRRVLAVLSEQQLAGKMSNADLERANQAFEAFERATDAERALKPRAPEPREIELANSFLLAAQLLVKRLKPEMAEFKARIEGNKTAEEKLEGLYDERDALRKRLAEIDVPEVMETHPRLRGRLANATKDKYNKQRLHAYEREQKSLLRAFEQISAKIEELELHAKGDKVVPSEVGEAYKISPHVALRKKRPPLADTTSQDAAPPAA